MSTQFSIPIDDEPRKFSNFEEVADWLANEQREWAWLWSGDRADGSQVPSDFQTISDTFSNGIAIARRSEGQRLSQWIDNAYGNGILFAKESEVGRAIVEANSRFGAAEARTIYRIHWQGLNPNHVKKPTDIRGMMLAADPSSVEVRSIAAELKAERTRYRSIITRLENRISELEAVQRSDVARRAKQFRRAVRLMSKLSSAKAESVAKNFHLKTERALGSIAETEDRYANQMGLRAPVQYWKDKAKKHKDAEDKYGITTLVFFLLSAVVIGLAAWGAGKIVLSVSVPEDRAPVYLLVAGTLLGLSTLMFWAGRLIVKLWLSEHHLRKDALERSVMTETFLSLQEGEQATEADKAIVLAAIFRPSPDGVVKEEGPTDIGVQAAIAKLLTKP